MVFEGRELLHEHSGETDCVADAHRLTQLLGNLVANAMAYGAPRRPVRVSSRIDADAGIATITVHNEGLPIPAELMPRLFEPMTRGEGVDNSQRSVGLGLYIVRQIARAHGGDVEVASTAHDGTSFMLRMPRRPPVEGEPIG